MIETHELILVVEDEPDDVALIRRAFRKVGLANPVRFVNDGESAQHYLSHQGSFTVREENPSPALVLLDLKLPRKSGLEVLEWIRSQPGFDGMPVVVLTSSRHARDLKRAYELGANSYLVKPVAFEDLVALVDALRLYWVVFNEAPRPEARP